MSEINNKQMRKDQEVKIDNTRPLYKVVIWLTGKQDHDKEYTIFAFKTKAEAYEVLEDELEGVKKWWNADGCVYEMTPDELDRLGYGRFR